MFNQAIADEMVRLLPPPDRSIAPPPWDELAMPGGHSFPRDYRWFMETYGAGAINDYIHVLPLTPWSPGGRDLDAVKEYLSWSQTIDSCSSEHNDPDGCDINWRGEFLTFAADDPGGLLLCWGKEDGGNLHYWAREADDPDTWPIMTFSRPDAEWLRFEGGFVECLLAVMRETYPYPGEPVNPEEEWDHARARPVWGYEGDWNGPVDWP
jgi:hypothetical protein